MEPKQWLCRNGHVLGLIQWNGSKVPYLALYRHAVDTQAERPVEVDVIGPVMGRLPVRCDVEGCGGVGFWDVSVEALAGFVRGLNPKQLEQLEARLRSGRVRKRTVYKNKARMKGEG